MNEKQEIRNRMKALCQTLPSEMAERFSMQICNRLAHTDYFITAHCIAIYNAIHGEVQTAGLIAKWDGQKQFALPAISGSDMVFCLYKGKEYLIPGTFGILSPDPTDSLLIASEDIDLFILPGMAFDRFGNRLGRGKGYYDRYLSNPGCSGKPVVGLCFDFQLLNQRIPTEPHDVSMTAVLTEIEH